MKQMLSPEEQLRGAADRLWETEHTLEQRGLPVSALNEWFNAKMWQRELLDRQARGELQAVEIDDEDY